MCRAEQNIRILTVHFHYLEIELLVVDIDICCDTVASGLAVCPFKVGGILFAPIPHIVVEQRYSFVGVDLELNVLLKTDIALWCACLRQRVCVRHIKVVQHFYDAL